MNNYPGKFIVLYGINNLGKSTQAKLLVERLIQKGFKAEYLKYPIYDLNPSGEILNDYLREGNFYNLSPKEAQIIYALNRTQYQSELIKKLEAGINIVAEDYTGTGIAWGIGAGVSETFLQSINSHLIPEDLVFLFDGERFMQAMEKTHKHETNNDLTTKVRWAHLKLKEELAWIKINANLSIEEIQEIIWTQVDIFLNNKNDDEVERPKEKEVYNYSGFKTFSEIVNNNHQAILEKIEKNNENNEKNKNENEAVEVLELSKEIENKLANINTDSNRELDINQDNDLIVEKISASAKLPQKAHVHDAGFDLFSSDYYSIPAYGQALVSTGIKIIIPQHHVGLVWDKSGLANEGITTMGGVIDSNYRGEIKVIIKNLSEDDFNIVPEQKIAQLLIQAISSIEAKEGKVTLGDSARAESGFGSSGKF